MLNVAVFLASVSSLAAPAADSGPTARAAALRGTISIDGRLDEPAWASAAGHAIRGQKLPHYGTPASLPTTWRALVGARGIYLGIRCDTTPAIPIIARRTRRDRPIESDRITVDIDSRGQRIDAFHFEITAGGSIVDGIRYNDTKIDLLWDANWSAMVATDAQGWTVELEIPFEALRRPAESSDPMGIQVRRYITALGETDEWSPTPRDGSQEVSRYGRLDGVSMPARRLSLDLLPYLSVGPVLETGTGVAPRMIARGGADLKLRIGTDLTFDVSALPDYGNVEADTAVLNLSTLELRFPEKRLFFLEGVDILETPLNVLYTRRIGSLSGNAAGTVVKAPPPAPVLGASKLVARLSPRWTVASLVAVTRFQDTFVRDPSAALAANQRLLPSYIYGVLRARYGLPNAGSLGLLATTRTSFDQGPRAPWAACPDGQTPTRTCFADTHVLSSDARIRSKTGMWVGTAQLLGTFRVGGTPMTGIDGNTLASGDKGGAALAQLQKTGGRLIGALRYEWDGRDADWNATGFLPQPHRHVAGLDLAVQNLTPHGPVLEDRWHLEVYEQFTLDGLPNGSGYQLDYHARTRRFWQTFTAVHLRPSYVDIRELRDGTPFQRAGMVGLEQELTTDSRKPVIGELAGAWQQRRGSYSLGVDLNLDLNLREALQFRLGVTAALDRGEIRWTETDAQNGLFRLARLDARALGLLLRVNYTITSRLELQAYTQVFGAVTDYNDAFTAPVDGDRVLLNGLVRDPNATPIHEGEALVAANVFLRWEYSRGSNLWLVFARNQLDASDPLSTGRLSLYRLGTLPASYLFMVKTTVLIGASRALASRRRKGN